MVAGIVLVALGGKKTLAGSRPLGRWQMTLMSVGLYNEPAGAFMP